MISYRVALFVLAASLPMAAQEVRGKDVREIAKGGSAAMPRLREFLKNADIEIRLEAVKQIVEVGTQYSLDPLIEASRDNDSEMQIRATDGLVNFYLPGYVRTGLTASVRRVGSSIKGRFTDNNDQVIDPFIQVRPDVIAAVGKLARGGMGLQVRANAARAAGVLRGKEAVPDLIEALRTKDSDVLYESLVALQKIRDESAGPRITFLLRDLDPRVQIAAIETTGLLRNREAVPALLDALNRAPDAKVRRAALTAIAMLPDEKSRPTYARFLADKDERMRGAAAEGYARLKSPADLPMLEAAWKQESKSSPRLSLAFALVTLGKTELSEFSPLQFLINSLNSAAYSGEALPFLIETARELPVRQALYQPMRSGTKAEKIGLAQALAHSGDETSIPELQRLAKDPDPEVAQEGLRAQRTLQARY